jgi:predicted MFS family arabinose efflux permease
VTGFAIDTIGHVHTFVLLFLFPLTPLLVFARNRPALPDAEERRTDAGESRVMDLLRSPALRRVIIASGLLNMAWDIYIFVVPIYGSRIGLSASTIGVVMSSFAIATFTVRLLLPILIRHVRPWQVITVALSISAAVYCLFPLFTSVPLLVALSCTLGLGLGSSQPMVMALLYNTSPSGRQGETLGLRTTVMNASHAALPLAFGALGTALGMGPAFWAMAMLLGGGAYFVNSRKSRD